MVDLTAFGLEPQEPSADNDDDETDEAGTLWPECADCGYDGPEVKTRLNQSIPLCTACFADREGLL